MGIEDQINKRFSRWLLQYPWYVFGFASVVGILLTLSGILCTPYPDFSDPSKGFYARGSNTMTNKLMVLKELITRMKTKNQAIPDDIDEAFHRINDTNEPIIYQRDDDGECVISWNTKNNRFIWPSLNMTTFNSECLLTTGGLFKIMDSNNLSFNDASFHKYSAFEFYYIINSKTDQLSVLRQLCNLDLFLHQQLIDIHECDTDSCHYSLPGIASDVFGYSNCSMITDADWLNFMSMLKRCITFSQMGLINQLYHKRAYTMFESVSNQFCFTNAVNFALNVALDSKFSFDSELLRFSIWIPIRKELLINDKNYAFKQYNKLLKLHSRNEQWPDIRLEALNLANGRIQTAMQSIRQDMYLVLLAVMSILIITIMYTQSLIVCFVTIYNVILALGCAYSTYQLVLRITIFPYINLMSFFLLIGLSCDNVFVFTDIWIKELNRNVKDDMEVEDPVDVVGRTLRHATVALFVTSCTTSAAFFTNMLSEIVYIQMFGLYMGMCIMFLFLGSVIILPAALIITHRKYEDPVQQAETQSMMAGNASNDKISLSSVPTANKRMCDTIRKLFGKTSAKPKVFQKNKILKFISKIHECIFSKFIPYMVTRHAKLLPFLLSVCGIIGFVAMFVWPKMKFPENGLHRFFTNKNHPMEMFEFSVRHKFSLYSCLEKDDTHFPQFIFVSGVKAMENGNNFLNFDTPPVLVSSQPSLNFFDPKTILWIDNFIYDFLKSDLFVESDQILKQWAGFRAVLVNSNANKSSTDVMCSKRDNSCFGPPQVIESSYRKLIQKFVGKAKSRNTFQGGSSNLRIFFLEQPDFHAIAFLVRANASFDNYPSISKYLSKLDRRLQSDNNSIWYASRQLAMYDMQKLIAKGVVWGLVSSLVIVAFALLISTANLLITIMSLFTISFILADTIAVFVLFGWKLNFMETIIIITAVGLSVDFTVHYGVAFLHAPKDTGQTLNICCNSHVEDAKLPQKTIKEANLRSCVESVGPAVSMSALTTFFAGMSMSTSRLTSFSQMGFFLMLIMLTSWTYATFMFLPLCFLFGPSQHWGNMKKPSCLFRK